MRSTLLVLVTALVSVCQGRYVMYLTGQHNVVPQKSLVEHVTHVTLAFMGSDIFNGPRPAKWPLFTDVETVRSKFSDNAAIMIAIGGWGDTMGFSRAAGSPQSRQTFAKNIKAMIDDTGADGVDIDWEYPGGNGEDYKSIPNEKKAWEIDAYPKLLAAIREAVGPEKIMSAAVPGLSRDMLGFTKTTVPQIANTLDFLNIMTYDLMNRRDNITKHHTGLEGSLTAIDAYLDNGLPVEKANLGFAFYVKWYRTDILGNCAYKYVPVGCKTELMEDPETGADLGKSGAFSWHDEVPKDLRESLKKAMGGSVYDDKTGGNYFWDSEERIFWSWDTPASMAKKFPEIVKTRNLGGVFAWGLGEDAPVFLHLKTLTALYRKFIQPKKKASLRKEEL